MKKILVCPKCRSELKIADNIKRCENGHSYDIAKQGYVNLTLGRFGGAGDDKEMCRSRHEFHNRNYYRCLADKLSKICLSLNVDSIVDAGCGEGYYLRQIRDYYVLNGFAPSSLCGIDLAKEAILLAARLEKANEYPIEYAVAGIFDMPIGDDCCNCVLSVFAPVPDAEAFRILKKDGYLIVVSPGEKHLEGLKNVLYDVVYDNVPGSKEYTGFKIEQVVEASDTITVSGKSITDLFHMTPYYWKTSEEDALKLQKIENLTTKIEFIITIYKKIM